MNHIKKLIAMILTVAAVFSTCTGTICAESDGRPEGTEMVDEWIDYVDLYYNLTYYVIVGDANWDYVVDHLAKGIPEVCRSQDRKVRMRK